MSGVFVVGTDTGVGKTTVSIAVIEGLRARGLRVAAMKPCETGDGDDAVRLREASGLELDARDLNPYRFSRPAAPWIAARAEGQSISFAKIVSAYERVRSQADFTVVEGAGGLLVPFTNEDTTVELIQALALPVLVVARTALGTINHCLLTLEVARARGLRVVGIVFSRIETEADPGEREVIATIERLGQVRSLGVLATRSSAELDLDGIVRA